MLHAAALTIPRVGKDPIVAHAPLPMDFDAMGFDLPEPADKPEIAVEDDT
jgi:tRNA pseudouridine32 synthase/23S rRNA pseudouridine746 synthase